MLHAFKYFNLILNYFQVSEDPSMREEMEKEVGSTNSAVVAAAAGWANWAVGAVTAKFYKSPPAPAPGAGDKDKSASPASAESSLAEGVKSKVNISSEPSKQSSERESSSSNHDAGWDVAEDDGWGDLNNDQEDEVKNDGWDDNDDWGSLEDNKSESKSVSQPSFDHSGGFNQGVKSHGAFSDLQQTSAPASDNLMAGPGGWDDWGGGGGGGEESKEEARRRREEKRVERQKELQSKRAAKKGPMKLGAKKMID